jgi:hypothetical protein
MSPGTVLAIGGDGERGDGPGDPGGLRGFDGGDGDNGFGAGSGGQSGPGCCSSTQNLLRALAVEEQNKANLLLEQLKKRSIAELENQRDLEHICDLNDCHDLSEALAGRILENALRDTERSRSRVRDERNELFSLINLIFAGLATAASFAALFVGFKANLIAKDANRLAVQANERSVRNESSIDQIRRGSTP